jgi:hypothetical protein
LLGGAEKVGVKANGVDEAADADPASAQRTDPAAKSASAHAHPETLAPLAFALFDVARPLTDLRR